MKLFTLVAISALLLCAVGAYADKCATDTPNMGYLDNPQVFIGSDIDFPMADMTADMPGPGETIPEIDVVGAESDGWRQDGQTAQPSLRLRETNVRLGAVHGFNGGAAVGLNIPFIRRQVLGNIGGQPAAGIAEGLGELMFFGKKALVQGEEKNNALVLTAGLEAPTGKDNSIFGPNNPVTNAYYRDHPQRMPIGWQPSSGTWNGYLALAYRKGAGRVSYEAIIATKLYGAGVEDSKIGNILQGVVGGTYGVSRNLALGLDVTVRMQADDEYPNAPPPGINQPALAGTTTHGTTVFLDPTLRYNVLDRVAIGVGLRVPVVDPEDGEVPQARFSVIFSPGF